MQVESNATPMLTIDEVEKVQRQKIASFIGYVLQLTNAALIDKLIQQEKLHHCHGLETLYFNFVWLLQKTFFLFSISRKWKTIKVLSFSRTASQLIMRVHKPKVEYKLVHLYRKNPREHLDVLVYRQF